MSTSKGKNPSGLFDTGDTLLTPDDIAARLRVSRSMIYTLIKRGELAAIYVGRLPRVSEAAYAEYVARLAKELGL